MDPSLEDTPEEEVRLVHPYQALKPYRCPQCRGTIGQGVGHVVVTPRDDPDLRRHWHRACWRLELRRRGAR